MIVFPLLKYRKKSYATYSLIKVGKKFKRNLFTFLHENYSEIIVIIKNLKLFFTHLPASKCQVHNFFVLSFD